MIKRFFTLLLFSVIALPAVGQSISGVVHLDGPRPKRTPIALTPESRKLYEKHPLSEVKLVSAKGEVQNVFVYMKKGLLTGKSFPAPKKGAQVNQKKSMFRPRIQGILIGQEVFMRNSDPVIHNVRSLSSENRPFNIGQPAGTPDRKKVFKDKEGPIELRCDFHPWMNAQVHILPNEYFDVSDTGGKFKIMNIPPGTYTLEARHEKLAPFFVDKKPRKKVTIKKGETLKLIFEIEAPKE